MWTGAAVAAVLLVSPLRGQAVDAAPTDLGRLEALAPVLAQIVGLAAADPRLAANLVPDPWLDSLVSGALAVEAESPRSLPGPDAPRRWPIGPWATPASLERLIRAFDPPAVVALYRALTPRLETRCNRREMSFERCDRAIRAAGARLSECRVLDRAAGRIVAPITPTQRELSRLGGRVVGTLRGRIHAVATPIWGASFHVPRRCEAHAP